MSGSAKFVRRSRSHREGGYILLTLMFLATLLVLSLVALAPKLTQQIKRDQEEELIHRGVQYSRAIQHFYKKTGRYPVRMEELDNFNNVRFLRKHYKDPITGQDFKLLHFGEVQTMFAAGGTGIPGAAAAANQPGGFGNPNNAMGGFNNQVAMNSQGFGNQAFGNQAFPNQGLGNQGGFNQPGNLNQQVQGANQPSTDEASNENGMQPVSQLAGNNASGNLPGQGMNVSATGSNNQVFGGGPIVGVASTSTKKSIREFNKKNHYKDWQFIYDPSSDRGGLLNTPAQPNLAVSMNNSGQGNNQSGPGQGQGFGPQGQQPGGFGQQPGGFGQQPNSFGQQGMPMPNQPPDQMQPQQ
jgi:type II secretory pathway pseudopilin PulG